MDTEALEDLYFSAWEATTEHSFERLTNQDFLYRMVTTMPRKSAVKYEDDNILLSVFFGRNERYLGFGLRTKQDFVSIHQPHWVLLADATSTKHSSPEYIVDCTPMRMIKCVTDGSLGHSYWLSARRKDTCL